MQDRNPYAAPKTNVTRGDSAVEDFGEVRIFAVSGRIGRVRFIAYSIWLAFLVVLATAVLGVIAAAFDPDIAITVVIVGYIAVYAIQFLPAIQRSHDMNVTGWLSLISLVPFGIFVFLFASGTRGENSYGKQPPPNGIGVILVACLAPFLFFGGIMAAIAIPAYQDFTIRSQIVEGFSLADAPKAAVAEAFERSGVVPEDRLAVGLPADPTQTSGEYVASVGIARGTILVTYGNNAHASIAGGVLAFRPYVMPDRSVAWRCGQGPVPDGGIAMDAGASSFTTDIIPKYLPSRCRPL